MAEVVKEFTVKVPIEKAWDLISDMERFSLCIPGCKEVTRINETEHDWIVEAKVLRTTRKIKARTKAVELRAPSHASFVGEGKLIERLNYYKINIRGTTDLKSTGNGETKVRFAGTIQASGLGGSIIEKVASGQMEGLFQDFEKNVRGKLEHNKED